MQRNPTTREAQLAYSKATKAELAKEYDSAYQNYAKAAELFLHFSQVDGKQKAKWLNEANKSIQRAEKIKQFVNRSNESRAPSFPVTNSGTGVEMESQKRIHLTPVHVDLFSPQQQLSWLRKSSTVNGLVIPLWDEHANSNISNPLLSAAQGEMSAVWRAPSSEEFSFSMSTDILPQDISQNVIADCSVCASISVCLEYAKRFGKNPIEKLLHARSNDIFDLRLLFNGAWRKISIDNQLPYHPKLGITLCLTCSPDDKARKPVLWPSLVEKAYMKLMGGYDFPGSNSTIDLHTLIGWIPEHLHIKSSSFERERTWTRLITGFTRGDCMVTVGTSKVQQPNQNAFELLPSHSYAVIDIRKEGNERILTILDPWVRPSDTTSTVSEQPSRILNLTWTQVLNIFEGIYVSWDPQIWLESLIHHRSWRPQDTTTISSARVTINSSTDENDEILVLLSRHIDDTRRTSEFIALKVQLEDEEVDALVTDHGNDYTISTKGSYTNSPHILARVPISKSYLSKQSSATLSVSALYDGQSTVDVGYTISVYAGSQTKLAWDNRSEAPMFSKEIAGKFNNRTAGGNPTYSSFMFNPQYYLHLPPPERSTGTSTRTKTRVVLTVKGSKDLPMQIMVVWSQGQRIIEPSEKDVVATSGPYTYGVARILTQLLPGDYNVIVSIFEPGQLGDFKLNVASSLRFDLTSVLQEGAGLYPGRVRKGVWEGAAAAGAPSFNRYFENPIFEVDLSTAAKLQVRLQLDRSHMSSPLNVAIYPAPPSDTKPNSNGHLATSGGYSDALSGVITPLVHLAKGKYWIVPSTYNPGTKASFRLIVYSSVGVEPERVN
ncbi:cysteine proteinase [Marasmius fiardii PR-910]|nr:cysteine proteinase [Marasmius fiardii PR-910]